VIVEELLAAPVGAAAAELFGVPVVYSAHNLEAAIAYPYPGGRWARPLQRRDRRALDICERRLLAQSDGGVACTIEDAEALGRGAGPVVVVPNCGEPAGPPPPWPDRAGIVLTGSFGWLPNLEGLRWFVAEVLPIVRRTMSVPVSVVTSTLNRRVRRSLADDGIEVHVNVPDVASLAQRARVAVVPVFTAGGSRVRIVDALELGLQVVTTGVGVQGQGDSVRTACRVADEASTFARAIAEAHAAPAPPSVPALPRWGAQGLVVKELWDRVGRAS
jgi:hypothetical protein